MKLTSFTDYSLRVLMYLAVQPERRATVAEIAQAFGVSENHLTKVVHGLGRQGWIETSRGRGGGMLLAKAPQDIRIGEVVRDTEGAAVPAECFSSDGRCVIDGGPIEQKRLQSIPWTPYCLKHQQEIEERADTQTPSM
jgi:Rrf2 family nitric oxide-sensitive transcriptional repressor